MYKLRLSRRQKKELALSKWFLMGLAFLSLAAVIWLAWIRPAQKAASIDSFDKCKAAGNAIQESYPEVCHTKDGKRFVHPGQAAAHEASLKGVDEPVAPASPDMLYLNIKEWGARVPLTEQTFDLTYIYVEDGLSDRIKLTYKRLINADVCTSDIGLTLSRTTTKHQPPYSIDNPEPLVQVGNHYYYAAYGGSPCYDPDNPGHMALVSKIAGDKSLLQTTTDLLRKAVVVEGL